MIKYTSEEYKKRVEKLPLDLKKMITEGWELRGFIKTVYDQLLDLDERKELEEGVYSNLQYSFKQNLYTVMIGLLPPYKFKDELIKDGFGIDLAEKISTKTHYYIFREVKTGLREIYSNIKITPKGKIIEIKEEERYSDFSLLKENKTNINKDEYNDPYLDPDKIL